MSRIGKKIIQIPSDVFVSFEKNLSLISVKGKLGVLQYSLCDGIDLIITKETIKVIKKNEDKKTNSYYGLTRVIINNMILGVQNFFSKILVIEGVGYKFQINSKNLIITAGFSHPIILKIPESLFITQESPTKIVIKGIHKESVGLFASIIRQVKTPEPYKGKGIRYEKEIVSKKIGKNKK